jgi:hypothetical protein
LQLPIDIANAIANAIAGWLLSRPAPSWRPMTAFVGLTVHAAVALSRVAPYRGTIQLSPLTLFLLHL